VRGIAFEFISEIKSNTVYMGAAGIDPAFLFEAQLK
jgi:hypothetical protein